MSTPAVKHEQWSIADLTDWPEDGSKTEIIDGSLHVTPSPSLTHAALLYRLRLLLDAQLPAGFACIERVGLQGPGTSFLEPDLTVMALDTLNRGGQLLNPMHAMLAVEVVSPSSRTHDTVTKPRLYHDWGVHTYLAVDLERGQLLSWSWHPPLTTVGEIAKLRLCGTDVKIELSGL